MSVAALVLTISCTSKHAPKPTPVPSTPTPTKTRTPATGAIDGTAEPCAPMGAPPSRVVTVRLQDAAGKPVTEQHVAKPWTFTFVVAAGDYTVMAPAEHDNPITVHVAPGATAHVRLVNPCK